MRSDNDAEYLEIARRALRNDPTPPDTRYADLTYRAMQRIEEVCPPGALRWAREARPDLTDRIDQELLARLNNLWNTYAPVRDFEAALNDLVRSHAQVGQLFVNHDSSGDCMLHGAAEEKA